MVVLLRQDFLPAAGSTTDFDVLGMGAGGLIVQGQSTAAGAITLSGRNASGTRSSVLAATFSAQGGTVQDPTFGFPLSWDVLRIVASGSPNMKYRLTFVDEILRPFGFVLCGSNSTNLGAGAGTTVLLMSPLGNLVRRVQCSAQAGKAFHVDCVTVPGGLPMTYSSVVSSVALAGGGGVSAILPVESSLTAGLQNDGAAGTDIVHAWVGFLGDA